MSTAIRFCPIPSPIIISVLEGAAEIILFTGCRLADKGLVGSRLQAEDRKNVVKIIKNRMIKKRDVISVLFLNLKPQYY